MLRSPIMATLVQRGETASAPVHTVQHNEPHQPMAGKRIPAASTGEAQPIIPSGGTMLRRIPTGARQSDCLAFLLHTKGQQMDTIAADVIQSASVSRTETSGPKKLWAPGNSGHRAAP
jgi:hypothetical protein